MKAIVLVLIISSIGYVTSSKTSAAALKQFRDVPTSHWAYQPIMFGVDKGYISGRPDGMFSPGDSVTVAEFITMMELTMTEKGSDDTVWWSEQNLKLVPAWHYNTLASGTSEFETGSPWYKNYIDTAKGLDVIRGEYETRYNEPLTREMAAKLVSHFDGWFHGAIDIRYAQLAGPQFFKDYNRVDGSVQVDVAEAALRGIMNGSPNGYFNPKATITRAEAAQICMVLADSTKRIKKAVNLTGIPYSVVPNPGYDPQIMIFANQEMNKVYDAMTKGQKDFLGATDSYNGNLIYCLNDDMKQQNFDKIHYMRMLDKNIYYDLSMSFSDNTYGMLVSTLDGGLERVSDVTDSFLTMIDKNNAATIKRLITDGVSAKRSKKAYHINKVIGGRQVIIETSEYDSLMVGISSYADKK